MGVDEKGEVRLTGNRIEMLYERFSKVKLCDYLR